MFIQQANDKVRNWNRMSQILLQCSVYYDTQAVSQFAHNDLKLILSDIKSPKTRGQQKGSLM